VEHISAITYIAALDESSTTLYVSPLIETILGISPADYKAAPDFWVKHLHPDDRERVMGEIRRCHESDQPFISEYRIASKDGRLVWLSDDAVIVKDDKGNHLQGVMYDITERKHAEQELEESRKRLRVILEHLQTGVMIIDAETHEIFNANLRAVEMMGAAKEEIVGKICHKFVCPVEQGKCPISDLGQSIGNSERERINANGETIAILKSVVPVTLNGHLYFIESFVDIRERKRAENELKKKKNEELELFNRLTVGRELKMIELKKEINALLEDLGKEPRYEIAGES
jgi:PAS domain S-box-containing protein